MNARQAKKAFKKKYGVNPKYFWKGKFEFTPYEFGQQLAKNINTISDMIVEYARSLQNKESEETE
jgi:hypothetical protein